MSRLVMFCVAFLSLLSTCSAQSLHTCKYSGTSFVGRTDGISIQRVSLIEKRGTRDATVFIPDGDEPLPAVVFSHSAIHGPYNSTDLLRFAWALARAGAATIVLDGTIEWLTPNDDSIRPREFQFCAEQWMFHHVNLDLTRLANAGNFKVGWIPDGLSHCAIEISGKARCWPGGLWMGFGQTSPAESRNTDSMLTPEGELFMARFAQKHLRLREIDPQWLIDNPLRSSAEISNRPPQQQP